MSEGNAEFTAEFFDRSSEAWMANKVRRGAMIYYRCAATLKNGKPCKNHANPWRADLDDPYECGVHIRASIASKTSSKE